VAGILLFSMLRSLAELKSLFWLAVDVLIHVFLATAAGVNLGFLIAAAVK
jgi:hypothetical protein